MNFYHISSIIAALAIGTICIYVILKEFPQETHNHK